MMLHFLSQKEILPIAISSVAPKFSISEGITEILPSNRSKHDD